MDGDIFIDPLKNARRIHFLAAAICALITGQFLYSTPLPVECILEYLNMFTLVSNGNIKDGHSIDVFAVGYVIPILYDNIFIILRALLIRFDLSFVFLYTYTNLKLLLIAASII